MSLLWLDFSMLNFYPIGAVPEELTLFPETYYIVDAEKAISIAKFKTEAEARLHFKNLPNSEKCVIVEKCLKVI